MQSAHEILLWDAINKKEYKKVPVLISEHPDLVNAVNANGRTLLVRLVLLLTPPLDLIQWIANQPNLIFDPSSSESTQTTVGAILSTGRPDILQIFADDSRIVFDGNKLSYATAKKNRDNAAKAKIENHNKMLQILRDATIRYAIQSDEPSLLEQLKAAGDNLSQELSDGKLPVRLITKEKPAPKVKSWFQSQVGTHETSIASHAESFFTNLNEMAKTKEQMDELTRSKLKKEITLLDEAYESTLVNMEKAGRSLSISS